MSEKGLVFIAIDPMEEIESQMGEIHPTQMNSMENKLVEKCCNSPPGDREKVPSEHEG